MLQSPNTCKLLLEKGKENDNGLSTLKVKMKQSLEDLYSIQALLKGGNKRETPPTPKHDNNINKQSLTKIKQEIQQQCNAMKLTIDTKDAQLKEKQQALHRTQVKMQELTESLRSLALRHDQEKKSWDEKNTLTQKALNDAQDLASTCAKKNHALQISVNKLEELQKQEKERNEQLQLYLQEDTLKLEKMLEDNQRLTDKEKEIDEMQSKLNLLELENTQYKTELEVLNNELLYHHKLQLDQANKESIKQVKEGEEAVAVSIKQSSTEQDNSSTIMVNKEEFNEMKKELERLSNVERLNIEWEKAMEQSNEHCRFLQAALKESSAESKQYYKTMVEYREKLHAATTNNANENDSYF